MKSVLNVKGIERTLISFRLPHRRRIDTSGYPCLDKGIIRKTKGFTYQGNIIINLGGLNTHTIIHEIGHALGLKHPFEEYENIPLFEKGTTDNYIDYEQTEYGTENPHKGKMFSLFKWQWDNIHKNKKLKFSYEDDYKSFWDIF